MHCTPIEPPVIDLTTLEAIARSFHPSERRVPTSDRCLLPLMPSECGLSEVGERADLAEASMPLGGKVSG